MDLSEERNNMEHAQMTEQGDCSKFSGIIPHYCKRDPIVVDLLPGTPHNQQRCTCDTRNFGCCHGFSIFRFSSGAFVTIFIFLFSTLVLEAYDSFDPKGNITVKWDVSEYVATVTIFNYHQYRHIEAPSCVRLPHDAIMTFIIQQAGRWDGRGQAKNKRDPAVVDLLPGTPYNQQSANCCKGGVINSLVQDPGKAISSFQLSVGGAGTTIRTVRLPKSFTLKTPDPGYTCGLAKIVEPSKFVSEDGRRVTQAMSKIHFSFISSSAFDLESHMHILTVPMELKKLLHAVSPSQPSKRITPLYRVPKMQLWLPQDQWKLCR
ncbi:hypothetical protein MTR67_047088, partial [Solanum verrucosum]